MPGHQTARDYRATRDPLFIVAAATGLVNTVLLRGCHMFTRFSACYFNDVLLVPLVLPLIVTPASVLGLRSRRGAPNAAEIIAALVVWSLAFEVVGPCISAKCVADPLDVVAYCLGGCLAWVLWRLPPCQAGELARMLTRALRRVRTGLLERVARPSNRRLQPAAGHRPWLQTRFGRPCVSGRD